MAVNRTQKPTRIFFFSWYHIVCGVQPRRGIARYRRQRREGGHFPGKIDLYKGEKILRRGVTLFFQRDAASKSSLPRRGEYNVYSTFQSHEPEFDYLKSLEIEEKINKIRWLKRKNPAHFLLSTNGNDIIVLTHSFGSVIYISAQTKPSSCGKWVRGTRGRRGTTWRRTVGCWGTPAASPASGCPSSSPWSWWWRPVLGGYSPMLTLTTSTPSQSTQTRSVFWVWGESPWGIWECFSNITAKSCLKSKSCPDRLTVNKHLCSLHLLCPSVWSFSKLSPDNMRYRIPELCQTRL